MLNSRKQLREDLNELAKKVGLIERYLAIPSSFREMKPEVQTHHSQTVYWRLEHLEANSAIVNALGSQVGHLGERIEALSNAITTNTLAEAMARTVKHERGANVLYIPADPSESKPVTVLKDLVWGYKVADEDGNVFDAVNTTIQVVNGE